MKQKILTIILLAICFWSFTPFSNAAIRLPNGNIFICEPDFPLWVRITNLFLVASFVFLIIKVALVLKVRFKNSANGSHAFGKNFSRLIGLILLVFFVWLVLNVTYNFLAPPNLC